MLERCPYYEVCDAETRQMRGDGEHYCLGSLNWEFCQQFKYLSREGDALRAYSRDEAIKQMTSNIVNDLEVELESTLKICLIAHQGEVLFRSRQWSEADLLVAQNFVRYKIDSINYGDSLRLQNEQNFLFLKIHQQVMLICFTKLDLDGLIDVIKKNLSQYHADLETYLDSHPLSHEIEPPEENVVLTLFDDLQKKLEAINPKVIIKDLNTIQEKISTFFSWNKIFYEISILIERLEQYPVQAELNKKEREKILIKIREWEKGIRLID